VGCCELIDIEDVNALARVQGGRETQGASSLWVPEVLVLGTGGGAGIAKDKWRGAADYIFIQGRKCSEVVSTIAAAYFPSYLRCADEDLVVEAALKILLDLLAFPLRDP
jgi:hypothetical protein